MRYQKFRKTTLLVGLFFMGPLLHILTGNLADTKVTDEGLKHLRDMKSLTGLRLDRTFVTDRGMKDLTGLSNLVVLGLSDNKVGDVGIQHLRPLVQLTSLDLGGSLVSD